MGGGGNRHSNSKRCRVDSNESIDSSSQNSLHNSSLRGRQLEAIHKNNITSNATFCHSEVATATEESKKITNKGLDSSLQATLSTQNDNGFSPSIAEGGRGGVNSLPFHFCKHSSKDSHTLAFSPKITRLVEPKAFALKAKDDALRLDSSSGGAFSLIAEYVLNRGGVVFGASFDENLNVVHTFIESIAQLDKLRRSKYVESFIGDSFKKARDFLKAGRIVLFSGVQCQIHGLNAFLRKPYPNLITIEVVCNSIPSPKIWDIYKQSLLESNDEKLLDFNFRGKDFGWANYCIALKTNKQQKVIPYAHSPYFHHAWTTHIITRKSCGNCYSKGFVSGADFTLGDFWGICEYHSDFVDNPAEEKGISCVLAHTKKALEILESISDFAYLIRTTATIITLGNPSILRSNPIDSNRDFVLKRVFSLHKSKGAKVAMDFLAQIAQNPLACQKRGIAHHYYRVFKDDPLRKAISNALKKVKIWKNNK